MLSPTTFFLATVSTIGALQAFNQIYVMTGGGPLDTTRTVVMLIFQHLLPADPGGLRLGHGLHADRRLSWP